MTHPAWRRHRLRAQELLPVELGGKRVSASKGSAAAEGAGSASPAAQLELESALAACVFVPDVE